MTPYASFVHQQPTWARSRLDCARAFISSSCSRSSCPGKPRRHTDHSTRCSSHIRTRVPHVPPHTERWGAPRCSGAETHAAPPAVQHDGMSLWVLLQYLSSARHTATCMHSHIHTEAHTALAQSVPLPRPKRRAYLSFHVGACAWVRCRSCLSVRDSLVLRGRGNPSAFEKCKPR
jgi:hypothetical protein